MSKVPVRGRHFRKKGEDEAKLGMDRQTSWTLAEVIQAYGKDGPSNSHHGGARLLRENASSKFLGTPIEQVSNEAFELELRAYLVFEGRRRTTGNRLVLDFNRLMQWAVLKGYRVSPFKAFPVPKPAVSAPEPLQPSEVERLLKVLDMEYRDDLGWRIVVRALVILGLEVEEAANFSFAKTLDLKGHYVLSDRKGRLRHIPIPKDMQVLITRAMHDAGPQVGVHAVIQVSQSRLMQTVRYLGERIGIPDLTLRRLQRTAVYGD